MSATQTRLFNGLFPTGSAYFSGDNRYRYSLTRQWATSPPWRAVFIGLNPSTANAVKGDMTIAKCIGFGKRWGYSSFEMVNLFGLVSTNPKGLLEADDPEGPENAAHVSAALMAANRVVLAWGNLPIGLSVRASSTYRLVVKPYVEGKLRRTVCTFGWTADGEPRHPSRLAYATPLEHLP